MTADRVEAKNRLSAFGRPNQHRHAGENVLEHRHAAVERSRELHPELGERAAGDHDDPFVRARLDERARHDQRVNGAAQNALTSLPLARTSPQPSAIAFASAPPPR